MLSCTRHGGQRGERHNNPKLTVGCIRHTKPRQQDSWCDHIANTTQSELCPVLGLDLMSELHEDVRTELRKDRWHRFWRHLRPELVRRTEQGHQCTSGFIHVQDASS